MALFITAFFMLTFCALADKKLSDEDWVALNKGEIVKEVKREKGTQSAAWSAGIYNHPPELMWKVITSLERYDEFTERTTVSVNLDEAAKNKVVRSGIMDADEVEKFFEGMKRNYVKKSPGGKWTVYSYQRSQLPWPLNDRWCVLEITHDDKAMKQTWRRLAGNIKEDYGSWELSAVEGGKTLAVNEIHLDLDIPATGPFVAFGMDVSLPDTYRGFEKMARWFIKEGQGKFVK